ncbi:MAG: adenine-specific methyltransferase EcoRI family protein [Oscillospiraceae bacterium]|nr:adenine-specific methyltransferase EcoRI family protein [Oscillospiraceae bacterium]
MATELFNKAKKNKVDEFYTQFADIDKEMRHYREQFKGKIIFCNCDDPYESNFFKYFALYFNTLGIKKLIATCYVGSPIADTQLSLFDSEPAEDKTTKAPHKIEIIEVEDYNKDGAVDLLDVEYLLRNTKNALTRLKGDGDFRSPECIALMKEADIVVTNPPFSLFREYVSLLVEYEKDFLIIGNTNALTYKEIFRLIKENRMRTGYTNFNVGMYFAVPDYWEKYHKIENGQKLVRVSTSCWFTSLDVTRHHENVTLYKKYTPDEYPKYDNYDAINVNTYTDIPYDYDGAMGVPVTFLDKYNPKQFEILGLTSGRNEFEAVPTKRYINPIQINPNGTKTSGSKANTRATLLLTDKPQGVYYTADNADGALQILYARIIIKRIGASQ